MGYPVTVIENFGQSFYTNGYGRTDLKNTIAVNNHTKFCIASITKTFTATLVVKVLSDRYPELGPAVLETPLRILHPNGTFMFSDRFRYESMSFRDLLSHRHGIQTESWGSSAGAFRDIEEFTFRSRYAPEVAPFRAGGFYSNTLVALAGKIIAEIAEQPYETLLQDFFSELGMDESVIIDEHTNYDLMANMSRGFILKDGELTLLNSSLINRVFVGVPAGGIISSANDMAKYITFHLNNGKVGNNQVVPEEALMWLRQPAAPQVSLEFRNSNSTIMSGIYATGSGFFLGVFDGWQFLNHNGQWTTFMSSLRIYPELGFDTFSVNNGPSAIGNAHSLLHDGIFKIVNGLSGRSSFHMTGSKFTNLEKKSIGDMSLLMTVVESSTPQNLTLESLVGFYGHPVEGDVEISLPNGTLYFRFGKWITGYLFEHSSTIPNTFRINFDSDFIHEFYFGFGFLVDIFATFTDSNTVSIVFEDIFTFRRGVSVETLPIIPWDPESCGPQ